MDKKDKLFLIADIGSTTTKLILITKEIGKYKILYSANSPTTVEKPFEDVNIGFYNAVCKFEEIYKVDLLNEKNRIREEIEVFATSSAGGGLQVLVIGLFSKITAISAQRAALGAGAIILDVITNDDKRTIYEKILSIRNQNPDMILLTGGFDGGSIDFILEVTEIINTANPKAKYSKSSGIPIIYAGNNLAVDLLKDILDENYDLHICSNIRPKLEEENLSDTKNKIHEIFLNHVMKQAPGYDKILDTVNAPVIPTPNAFTKMLRLISKEFNFNTIAVDIGGATTDVFSVINDNINRTVSANFGMSYSIANVMHMTGVKNILRWIPLKLDREILENIVGEKMIQPTELPKTILHIMVEQALAREAIRLSYDHHQELLIDLEGTRNVKDNDNNTNSWIGKSEISLNDVDLIIGSGGVLAHAPNNSQIALMLIDALKPSGVTYLAIDKKSVIPHLGVLSQKYPKIALDVFTNSSLEFVGAIISSIGDIPEDDYAEVRVRNKVVNVRKGEFKMFELTELEAKRLTICPSKNLNIGNGKGKEVDLNQKIGINKVFIDLREKTISIDQKKVVLEGNAYNLKDINNARKVANEKKRLY
ncbi:MAG: glutamate mutase L, partial [Clostridia bacterium]